MPNIQSILFHLRRKRFELQNEKSLQLQMFDFLKPIFPEIQREFILDKKNTIDFLLFGIGMEVKIKGSKMSIYKQCERYCKFEEIKSLILITNRSMGFPESINGKDCYVLNLGRAWL